MQFGYNSPKPCRAVLKYVVVFNVTPGSPPAQGLADAGRPSSVQTRNESFTTASNERLAQADEYQQIQAAGTITCWAGHVDRERKTLMRRPKGNIRQRSPGTWELRYGLGNDPANRRRRYDDPGRPEDCRARATPAARHHQRARARGPRRGPSWRFRQGARLG